MFDGMEVDMVMGMRKKQNRKRIGREREK